MYRLSEEEIEEILEGNELCALKNILYFSRPNYFQLLYQQDKSIVDEVFEKVKWELASYPNAHRHYFYNFIATYLAINGHQGKAEEYFLEAIRVKPSSEVTLANYVILLCETGNREKTAIYFKRLNELKQGSPEVKLDLAILFQLFNLNVAARVLLDDYVSKSANVNDFIMFLFGRVLLEHSLGKMMYDSSIEKAIKIFHDINRRSPKFLPNIDLLVKSLNQKWKISQKTNKNPHPYSIFIASKVNWSACCHSHAFYLHGKIRMRIGEMDGAKNALLRSVELTHNTHNHYQLGKCHMALSEVQEAGLHFREAQNLTRTYCVKFVLLEATSLVHMGRRSDGLKLINRALDNSNLSKHDKRELELFSAEHNIAAFPEVTSALDRALGLLYKSYSRRLYSRLINVVKVFTDHLSQYYSTTGLPHSQVDILMKWINFLKERGEITEEKHAELLRAKESFLAVKQPGRRISSTGRPGMSRRRSSVLSSGLSPAFRASPDQQATVTENKPAHLGSRVRRKSVVQPPLLGTPELTTPRSNSFILSLDSNDMAEENEYK